MTDTSDSRSRRWDDTHRRIYEAAMALFKERGYDAVNVGQIAKAAKVSVPTFYAHYTSKEEIVLPVPPAETMASFLAEHDTNLPVGERIRRATPFWLATFGPVERAELLDRWRVVATNPALRIRAGEYERATAARILSGLPSGPGGLSTADKLHVAAHLAAFTETFLTWADGNGERKLEEIADETFDALQGM
ncbi:MAG: TetR/AcrR family transcriptional regulator [Blastococcus sp.]